MPRSNASIARSGIAYSEAYWYLGQVNFYVSQRYTAVGSVCDDSQGTQTGVMIPIALWEKILEALDSGEKGLSPIDEDEPKERILSDLEDAVRSSRSGRVSPIAQLWDQVYE